MNQPTLILEDFGGQAYLRIEELRYDRGDYSHVIADQTVADKHNKHGFYNNKPDGASVLYENNEVSGAKYGITMAGAATTSIYDFKFDTVSTDKFGGAILLKSGPDLYEMDGPVTIQNVYADGKRQPLPYEGGYKNSNTDFIVNDHSNTDELTATPIFIRDFTAKNFSDAIVDSKGTVYIMNGTLENAYRVLRVWSGDEIIIVNSDITLGDGTDLAWIQDNSGRIKYYNTLWNGEPTPDPELISIGILPEGVSKEELLAEVLVELDHNPLPEISDFFQTASAQLHLEVSVDGGDWTEVELDPKHFTANGIIGDPLVALPDLGDGSYQARAWYSNGEGVTSAKSAIVTYEFDGATSGAGDPLPNLIPVESAEPVLDFTGHETLGVVGQDKLTEFLQLDGSTFSLAGNAWKAIAHSYTITEDTILSFDFRSAVEGEFHGIALEDNIYPSADLAFTVHGTQDWGIRDYTYAGDGEWGSFVIEVGEYFTGPMKFLTFINDHDARPRDSDSSFRNVRLYESDPEAPFDSIYSGTADTADTFAFADTPIPGSVFLVEDFEQGRDKLDLSDLLDTFDPASDAIGDYVSIETTGDHAAIGINRDGGGDGFVDLALVGTPFDLGLEDLIVA